MAFHSLRIARLWPEVELAVDAMAATRCGADKPLREGLNFSMILCSTCAVEARFEAALRDLGQFAMHRLMEPPHEDFATRLARNELIIRLNEDLQKKVGRTTGVGNYESMFELITGTHLSAAKPIADHWEDLTVMFVLRNVIGHGREVRRTAVAVDRTTKEARSSLRF